jgi:hypothetical protein
MHNSSHPEGVNTSNLASTGVSSTTTHSHTEHHHGSAPGVGAGLLSTGTSGFAREQEGHVPHTGDSHLHVSVLVDPTERGKNAS